jgi:hypothetical protein
MPRAPRSSLAVTLAAKVNCDVYSNEAKPQAKITGLLMLAVRPAEATWNLHVPVDAFDAIH